jgi:hypothetical protein
VQSIVGITFSLSIFLNTVLFLICTHKTLSSICIFPLNVILEFVTFLFRILKVSDTNFRLEIIDTKVSSDFLQFLQINDGTVLSYGPWKLALTPLQTRKSLTRYFQVSRKDDS